MCVGQTDAEAVQTASLTINRTSVSCGRCGDWPLVAVVVVKDPTSRKGREKLIG